MPPKKILRTPEVFELTVPRDSKYDADDLELILRVYLYDQRLEVNDCITLAQARYFMSTRQDGKIPPVMKQQVLRISEKYAKRVPAKEAA